MKKIFSSIKFSIQKARFYKGKSLFMILPIGLMLAMLVIASSEATALLSVAKESIFSSIASQNQVIELSKNAVSTTTGGGPTQFSLTQSDTDNTYTQTDIDTILGISNVEQAALISKLPLNNVKVTDLLSSSFSISNLAGLDSQYANIYTDESFAYTEGEAIPIILNANDFKETYEDWQGKDEITVDFSQLRQGFRGTSGTTSSAASSAANPADQSPSKTKSLDYNIDDLIGKEITVTVGGLSDISDVKQESTSTGFKYVKKSADDIQTESDTRKSAISTYWDYTKISTPLTYKFKVVGVIEGSDKTYAYVPSAFAGKVMQDYLNNELSARNSTAIPSSDYNSTFQGLIYDGVSLKDDSTSGFLSGIRRQISSQTGNLSVRPEGGAAPTIQIGFPDQSTSYKIPGLVYSEDRTTSEISGEYKSFDLTQALPLESDTMLIKIDDVNNRTAVVTALNDKGYTFTDYSNYESFNKLESYLHSVLNAATAIFMAITALFILLNMARFVSDSRKEIGIFRAIGATKMRIRLIFITQAFFYIVISMIFGVILGVIGIVALSGVMQSSAQSFINSAIGGVIKLSANITASSFIQIDAATIAIYLAILLIVTLLASLWPAEQAAKISPVEAIRN